MRCTGRVTEVSCGYRDRRGLIEAIHVDGVMHMTTVEPETREFVRYPGQEPAPHWTVSLVIIALLLALAGIGVGVYALATQPAKVSGPQGVQGPQGPQGKTGPAGTVASTTVVRGTPKVSNPNPDPGTVLDAQTTCPAGKILVSGGAQVTAPGVAADRNVTLRASFPVNETTWETVAMVTGPLGQGVSMTMTPYVVCGAAANGGSTTTSAP